MATLTNAWANHVYNLVNLGTAPPVLTGVYLRLFTADPTDAGSFTNEVAGGTYTGQDISGSMGAPANGVGTSTGLVTFLGMPAATITHWAKCKTAAGTIDADEMIEHGALAAPVSVAEGQSVVILAGDLDSTAD